MYTVPLCPLSAQDPETLDRGDVKIECAADLQIVEFNSTKPFKVVVTEDISRKHEIKLKALDPTFSANYTWGLGSGTITAFKKYWNLYPNEFAALDGVSYISAPLFFMPQNNSDFGETNGVILLKDNSGEKDLRQAQVFFEKDAPNFWNPDEPNWFYYWKQFVEYDNKDYGLKFSQNIQSDCNVIGAVACCNHIKKLLIFGQSVSENYNQTTDIHGFIQNLAHEDSHATIRKSRWPNGYDKTKDKDSDYVPDEWESTQEGIDYDFDPAEFCDIFSAGSQYKAQCPDKVVDFRNLANDKNSADFRYQEISCRVQEQLSKSKFSNYDKLDFSFDPKGIFNGKAWVK